jgi:hypothetical protein
MFFDDPGGMGPPGDCSISFFVFSLGRGRRQLSPSFDENVESLLRFLRTA